MKPRLQSRLMPATLPRCSPKPGNSTRLRNK
jgi:hypothetical protein